MMLRQGLVGLLCLGLSVSAQAGMDVAQPPIDTSQLATQAQLNTLQSQVPSLAPVQAVNTKTGQVTVPTLCRQQSAALAIPTTNPASVSWTFPNATCSFSTPPSCWSDITTGSTSAIFDYPVNTARATSAVTYTYTAHSASVAVVVAGVTVVSVGGTSGAPPSGSTVTMTCTAPPA